MFLSAAHDVAKQYPEVKYEDCSLDKACLQVQYIY